MTRRIAAVTGALALQLIALVLAHDVTFLARFGSRYGEELAHAGHGQTWTATVTSSVLLAIVLAALAIGRILQLRLRLGGQRQSPPPVPQRQHFLRTWLRTAVRLALLTVVLLTVQENVERASIGQGMPGPGILLSAQYPFGLWIALAVGAGVAFVAALFQHRERVLLARLRAARPLRARTAAAVAMRPSRAERGYESILGRRSGLRAPPAATPA